MDEERASSFAAAPTSSLKLRDALQVAASFRSKRRRLAFAIGRLAPMEGGGRDAPAELGPFLLHARRGLFCPTHEPAVSAYSFSPRSPLAAWSPRIWSLGFALVSCCRRARRPRSFPGAPNDFGIAIWRARVGARRREWRSRLEATPKWSVALARVARGLLVPGCPDRCSISPWNGRFRFCAPALFLVPARNNHCPTMEILRAEASFLSVAPRPTRLGDNTPRVPK